MKYGYLLVVLLLLFNCSSNKKEAGKNSSFDTTTLYLRLSANPPTLNPIIATDAYSANITSLIFDNLMDVDSNLNIIPSIAKKWYFSNDHKKLSFIIRNDIFFQDSVKLTTKDIKFTFDKIMDPNVKAENKRANYDMVDSLVVVNDTSFYVKYKTVNASAILNWASFTVIPKHIYSKGNFSKGDFNFKPVGSGPYVFEKYVRNERIKLKRNENYFRKLPKIKNIVYKVILENNSALNALLKNDIYVYGFSNPYKWKKFIEKKEYKKRFNNFEYYSMGYSYIGWNNKSFYFDNKYTRKAMTFALNRQEIVDKIYLGKAGICTGPFYPKSYAYDKTVKGIKFNLDSTRYYLKLAGWKDSDNDGILDKDGKKFEFNILVTSSSENGKKILEILKQNLSKVGVVLNIQQYEWGSILQRVHNRDFTAVIMGWSLDLDPDPYMIFHSSQNKTGLNYVSYKNSIVDSLLVRARLIFDKDKRTLIYHNIHRLINEDQPYSFLFYNESLVEVNKHIYNVNVSPLGIMGYYPGLYEWELR